MARNWRLVASGARRRCWCAVGAVTRAVVATPLERTRRLATQLAEPDGKADHTRRSQSETPTGGSPLSSTAAHASGSRRCRRTYATVLGQFDRLQTLAAQPEECLFARAPGISDWSVADHLSHIARATEAMVGAIETASGSSAVASRVSLVGRAVLLTGWIPRGVGKAPEHVEPQVGSAPELTRQLSDSRLAVLRLEGRLPEITRARGRTRHFAFGALTPLQWLRIIAVHTRHHLKIIRDIQRTNGHTA